MTTIAYRYIDSETYGLPTIGETLPRSYVWDGDEQTDEQLQGTCAFATERAAREYAKYSTGVIVEIEGERVMGGELAYEVIIRDAVVTRIVARRENSESRWE